jgi:diguanylate cyclase (GGDEF)-like protein
MSSALFQIITVGVVAFAAIALAWSALKYEQLREAARRDEGMELTPRDAFLLRISDLLGIGRRPSPFVIVYVEPETSTPTVSGLEEAVRRRLRRKDVVHALGGGGVGIIAGAAAEHAPALIERLRAALNEELPGTRLRFGWSAFPHNGDTAAALLEAAERGAGAPPPAMAAETADVPATVLDPLTGVLRAEDVDLAVHKYVARYRRERQPVSLIYADVADLKTINERYGQETGDAVLQSFSGVLQRTLREDDLIGRIGDDDFLVAAACAPSDAAIAAERVLRRVREARVGIGVAAIHYAVHIGIAGHPDHGGSPRVLFAAAESALAAARRKGRDVAVVYTPALRGLADAAHRSRDRF